MIDLHTHTTASDGASTPSLLVQEALSAGLSALAVTDHDTFDGSAAAAPVARQAGLDFLGGIELSTRFRNNGQPQGPSIHLLGYFPQGEPTAEFRTWVRELQASRQDRNARMMERLRALGLDVTLEELGALSSGIPGRPHFARLLRAKGYVPDYESAFREYLGESGRAYVPRKSAEVGEAIRRIRAAGGVPSLAHPVRLARFGARFGEFIDRMKEAGLGAIEVYHSEHSEQDVERFRSLARDHGLLATGGSDYHGDAKPEVRLGMGSRACCPIPGVIFDALRDSVRA
ncbi:MAG: PHP domain-containing protein [Acidobacteriales bacterium]|nr:PHP domain-containing protein [Terriglobales bacterium]